MTPIAWSIVSVFLCPSLSSPQERNVAFAPNAETIAKLDLEARNGFFPLILDRPFSVEKKLPDPITVYGGRRRISVGTTQVTWEAKTEDLSKPLPPGMVARKTSEGLFYRK